MSLYHVQFASCALIEICGLLKRMSPVLFSLHKTPQDYIVCICQNEPE